MQVGEINSVASSSSLFRRTGDSGSAHGTIRGRVTSVGGFIGNVGVSRFGGKR